MTGSEFKELRKNIGLTQQDIADILGISKRQVGNLENGNTPVKEIYVEKVSTFLINDNLEDRIIQRIQKDPDKYQKIIDEVKGSRSSTFEDALRTLETNPEAVKAIYTVLDEIGKNK